MLTLKQAWTFLAELWASTGNYQTIRYVLFPSGKRVFGICGCCVQLLHEQRINEETYNTMISTIRQYGKTHNLKGFYWDFDLNGAKQRENFCKIQADKL